MSAKQIVVAGGGFAGLWSALGAARKLDELGIGHDEVAVTLINRDAFHGIRVRNYEADLSSVRVPLDDVLGPVGVRRVEGDVIDIDPTGQTVAVKSARESSVLPYDRLIFALGSQLVRPNLPGIELAFDVDTYSTAARLDRHLQELPQRPASLGQFDVVIVGAGLTGIETAAEMRQRMQTIVGAREPKPLARIVLADHNPHVGSDMGESARPIIEQALAELKIVTRMGVEIASIHPIGVTLKSGEAIPAATVIWCAGMRANPLTQLFPVERDRLGRIPVDPFMRVCGVANVFAAGDVATADLCAGHTSVMSCQHGRPMGRFAGHNVVCDLLGLPQIPLNIDWYVTVLDLGPWGALYTEGWDRQVVAQGEAAKRTKQVINRERIYPPTSGDRAAILAAAAPIVQRPPSVGR